MDVSATVYTGSPDNAPCTTVDSAWSPNPVLGGSEKCITATKTGEGTVSFKIVCGRDGVNDGKHTFFFYQSANCDPATAPSDAPYGMAVANGQCLATDGTIIGASNGSISIPVTVSCSVSSTPAPTPAPVRLTQTITVTSIASADDYNSNPDVKAVYEAGYAKGLGILETLDPVTYYAGCSVESSAVSVRRAVTLSFTAIVASAQAEEASTAATALAASPATFVENVQAAYDVMSASGAITTVVAIPAASDVTVAAPTVIEITQAPTASSSSSSDNTVIIVVAVVGGLVLLGAVGAGAFFMSKGGGDGKGAAAARPVTSTELPAMGDQPPPGATYMKNGVWMDAEGKPVGNQV
jgi:hypothetical protein